MFTEAVSGYMFLPVTTSPQTAVRERCTT